MYYQGTQYAALPLCRHFTMVSPFNLHFLVNPAHSGGSLLASNTFELNQPIRLNLGWPIPLAPSLALTPVREKLFAICPTLEPEQAGKAEATDWRRFCAQLFSTSPTCPELLCDRTIASCR